MVEITLLSDNRIFKLASWWNGRHKGLKILALLGVPVQVRPRLPLLFIKKIIGKYILRHASPIST